MSSSQDSAVACHWRRELDSVIQQQDMAASLAGIHDQFFPAGEHLFHGFEIKARLRGAGCAAKRLLALRETAGVALRSACAAHRVRLSGLQKRASVPAGQGDLLIAIGLGLAYGPILLL